MSEAADSIIPDVQDLINEEDLTAEEQRAAEDLLTLLANASDIGSDEMKRMRPLLEKIPQQKRARHGLGWEM